MTKQTEMFDAGHKLKLPQRPCTPAPVGSGPTGETCGTCIFYSRVTYKSSTYTKCAKMEPAWTHGAASDIKRHWPACREWAAAASHASPRTGREEV